MTKRDYVLLASALRQVASLPDADRETTIICCKAVATAIACNNTRFDRERFLLACNPNDARAKA